MLSHQVQTFTTFSSLALHSAPWAPINVTLYYLPRPVANSEIRQFSVLVFFSIILDNNHIFASFSTLHSLSLKQRCCLIFLLFCLDGSLCTCGHEVWLKYILYISVMWEWVTWSYIPLLTAKKNTKCTVNRSFWQLSLLDSTLWRKTTNKNNNSSTTGKEFCKIVS